MNNYILDDLMFDVWDQKYRQNGETLDEFFTRIAKEFARLDTFNKGIGNEDLTPYGQQRAKETNFEERYKNLFNNFRNIIPGGSVLAGIGTDKLVSLSNCYVLGTGDSIEEIFNTASDMSQIYKRRGGNGIDVSSLRPRGALVNNAAKTTTGVVPFMELFSTVTNTIGQEGRRGALMISIDINHPDSPEFIQSKQDLSKITGANISVKLNNDFMKAVENDDDYILKWPTSGEDFNYHTDSEYNTLQTTKSLTGKTVYYKRIRAKELWDSVIKNAWQSAEPGVLFWDTIINRDPASVYEEFRAVSTNPCFVGNSLILTKDGYVEIQRLAWSSNSGYTESYLPTFVNENGEYVKGRVWSNGFKNVIKLVFDNDSYLECTPNHIFKLIDDTECEASNLIGKIVKGYDGNHSKVIKIEVVGIKEVFDFNLISDNHWGVVGGLIAHNCGEIPLSPHDSCRLIAGNLFSLVKNPFTPEASIDLEDAKKVFYEALVIGDILVDLELEHVQRIISNTSGKEQELWKNIYEIGRKGRRTGVGLLGLGDLFAALGLPYGDLETLEAIMYVKLEAELEASTDLAIINGPFPAYHRDLESFNSESNDFYNFIKYEYPLQYERMNTFGRRNISWSTIAPTGSISILAGVSSGCEPLFAPYYTRRKKANSGEEPNFIDQNGVGFINYNVIHPKFKDWIKYALENELIEPRDSYDSEEYFLDDAFYNSPWFGNTAPDLTPDTRVNTQAMLQKYTTHSISSTVNIAEESTKETVEDIYFKAWKSGCKGITVYRDGSRSGILVKENKTISVDTILSPRPDSLECKVEHFKNERKQWIAVVGLVNGKPYEIFTGPKDIEVFPVPSSVENGFIHKIRQEDGTSRYDFQYTDSYGYTNTLGGLSRVFDKEYWNYGRLVSGYLRSQIPITQIVKIVDGLTFTNKGMNNWKAGVIRALKPYIEDGSAVIGQTCDNCGSTNLVYENGCEICRDCLTSKCG